MGINVDALPSPIDVSEGKGGLAPIYRIDRKEFVVKPGQQITYKVHFQTDGTGPNMDISMYMEGKRIAPIMNNYIAGTREWAAPANNTSNDIIYTAVCWFKIGYAQGPEWTTGWMSDRGNFFGSCTAYIQFMPFDQKYGLIPWDWWWEPNPYWRADVAINIVNV